MQSDGSDSVSQSPTTQRLQSLSASDTRGKHRILAELKRFEQEARFLEEELEQLEKIDKASAACKEMLSNVETRPDPLLPVTEHMAPLIHFGTDGLKAPKTQVVANAGYFDDPTHRPPVPIVPVPIVHRGLHSDIS